MKEIIKAFWDPGRTNWGLICHFWLSLECKVKWIFWDIFHTYSEELLYDILQISDQFLERIYAYKLMRYFSVWGPSHEEHLSCVWWLCWLAAEQKSPRSTHRTATSGLSSNSPFAKATRPPRLHPPRAASSSGCAGQPGPGFCKSAAAPPAGRKRKRGPEVGKRRRKTNGHGEE